jgi:CBS domain containing-hemolysin-like protein
MDLQTQTAREIMVPRIKIQALPRTATRSELIRLLQDSGRTRIPIFEESIDEIIGVISAFDVLRDSEPGSESIEHLIQQVMHVPDTIHLDDLLKEMRAKKQTIAILTDEYGGTDGLICIEDILEEIFGEIHDEFDEAVQHIRKVGKNAFVIDARLALEDAAEAMKLPIKDDEVDTVGGWILHITNRIPKPGEVFELDKYKITVLAGDLTHISKIRLEVMPTDKGNG